MRTTLKDSNAVGAWLRRAEERKSRVHPEHIAFIETCQRCIDFRRTLFLS